MFGECHAHIFMNGSDYKKAVRDHKNGANEALVRKNLEAYRDAGVSFVRDGGDHFGAAVLAKKLAGEYGITYVCPAFGIFRAGHYGRIVGRPAETLTEYADLVKEAGAQHSDFIKIMISGIMDYREYGLMTEKPLEKEWIREMIHIAREEGFAVMAHANEPDAVLTAADAGVDSIEHGNYINEECLDAMAENDCVFVPTIATTRNLIGCGHFDDEVLRKIYEMEREQLKQAYQKGVLLATGSDAGAYHVLHGQGVCDEYTIFGETLKAIGVSKKELEERLLAGEQKIREKFSGKRGS